MLGGAVFTSGVVCLMCTLSLCGSRLCYGLSEALPKELRCSYKSRLPGAVADIARQSQPEPKRPVEPMTVPVTSSINGWRTAVSDMQNRYAPRPGDTPEAGQPTIDNGAFTAVAVADGDSLDTRANEKLSALPGITTEIFDDGDRPAAEITSDDARGVPPHGTAVRIRIHRRGTSALVTALGRDDIAAIDHVLRVLLDGQDDIPEITTGIAGTDTPADRLTARGNIPATAMNTLASQPAAIAEVLATVLSAVSSAPVATPAGTLSAADITWPASPTDVVAQATSSTHNSTPARVSVQVRQTPTPRAGRRELEWRAPEYSGEACTILAQPGPRGVRLTIRALAAFDPDDVLDTLTRVVNEWATTPNQPVDRPTMGPATQQATTNEPIGGPPEGDAEKALTAHMITVLELENNTIGRGDNFFRLGGDSMAALTLTTGLAEDGWTLDVQDVFLCPDVRTLAGKMSHTSTHKKDTTSTTTEPMSASGLDPATLAALTSEHDTTPTTNHGDHR